MLWWKLKKTNASKLSLLQRHREARELLVKIQADEADHERPRRPQSASCSETFGKRLAQSSRPKSAVPTTSEPSAAAAANLHFRPAPNPLPPHLGGGSAPSAPRKRPLSAFPSRVTVSPVGRRPASACGVRERFVHNSQVPDLDMNRMYFRDSQTPAVLLLIFVCPCWSNWKWEASKKKERLRRKQQKLGFEIQRDSLPKFVFWLNMERYVWYGYMIPRQKAKKHRHEKSNHCAVQRLWLQGLPLKVLELRIGRSFVGLHHFTCRKRYV